MNQRKREEPTYIVVNSTTPSDSKAQVGQFLNTVGQGVGASKGVSGLASVLGGSSATGKVAAAGTKAAGATSGLGAALGAAAPIAAGAAALGGLAYLGYKKDWFTTGKHEDQKSRDKIRKDLQKSGFLDENHQLILSDGTAFDYGKDGGFQYSDGFHAYEVDHNDELQSKVFGHAMPIAEMLAGGDDKLMSDFAGYLTRASISNTEDFDTALQNLRYQADKLGQSKDSIFNYTNAAVEEGTMDLETAQNYQFAANSLYGDIPATSQQTNTPQVKTVSTKQVRRERPRQQLKDYRLWERPKRRQSIISEDGSTSSQSRYADAYVQALNSGVVSL